MKPIIVCGVTGVGKTHACFNSDEFTMLDLDANLFINDERWNFPEDYVNALESVIGYPGEPDFIFMDASSDTLSELKAQGYDYVLVYPEASRKEEIASRIEKRELSKEHGDVELGEMIRTNFDDWVELLESDPHATLCIKLTGELNLSDVLSYIKSEVKKNET